MPVLWSGVLSGDATDAIVNARVDSLNDDVPDQEAFVNLAGSSADESGVATVRAAPGPWYERLRDGQGRVQLTLFASSDGGDQFGMGLLYVRWVTRADGSGGHWVSDEQVVAAAAAEERPESNLTADNGLPSSAGSHPTSEIRMSSAPRDLAATRSTRGNSGSAADRSIAIGGYTCDGPQHLLGSGVYWATIGKYYSAVGPTENWEYQTSKATSSAWGYSGEAGVGAFTLGGKANFAKADTEGAAGGGPIAANGDNPWGAAQVQMDYRLFRVDGCRSGGPPTGTNPGQPQTTKLTQLIPYRWTGQTRSVRSGGPAPARISNYTHTINPTQHLTRYSGQTTSTSHSIDVGIGWTNGFASLSGGISYTTGTSNGNSTSRSWQNPSSTSKKYIDSASAKPAFTGVYEVRGFNH